MLKAYLKQIFKVAGRGDDREESYYSTLETLLKDTRLRNFEGLKPDIWEYQIGGYQVCEKWLKDRKNRILSLEDIKHYCKKFPRKYQVE